MLPWLQAAGRGLECLYVGDQVLDLGGFQYVLERGHELIAIFNPGAKTFVGNLVSVDAEGAAFGNAFKARANFLLVASVIVADGTFLLKQRFATGHRGGVSATGLLPRVLGQQRPSCSEQATK